MPVAFLVWNIFFLIILVPRGKSTYNILCHRPAYHGQNPSLGTKAVQCRNQHDLPGAYGWLETEWNILLSAPTGQMFLLLQLLSDGLGSASLVHKYISQQTFGYHASVVNSAFAMLFQQSVSSPRHMHVRMVLGPGQNS